ncbi:hypothetical protein CcrBL47_gp414 [Caulobacter phage BL47]|nr:hypothetical protein CcrBL47_gp414 [Caulobacter phage BL47]
MKQRQRRVRAFTITGLHEARGYVGRRSERVQVLEERRWWGWKRIDEEVVPDQYLIDVATLGYSPSGWSSKFLDVIQANRAAKTVT